MQRIVLFEVVQAVDNALKDTTHLCFRHRLPQLAMPLDLIEQAVR